MSTYKMKKSGSLKTKGDLKKRGTMKRRYMKNKGGNKDDEQTVSERVANIRATNKDNTERGERIREKRKRQDTAAVPAPEPASEPVPAPEPVDVSNVEPVIDRDASESEIEQLRDAEISEEGKEEEQDIEEGKEGRRTRC